VPTHSKGATRVRFEPPPPGTLQPNNENDPLPFYYQPWVGWLYRWRLQMGLDLLPAKGQRVLEVGVGSGVLGGTLTRRYSFYARTDLELAPGLEQLMAEQCSANFQVVDLLRGDDLPTEAFDVIVCFSVLEHIRDLARAARQRRHVCVRVTVRRGDGTPNQKPGGASQNRERAVRAGYPLAMHPSADPER